MDHNLLSDAVNALYDDEELLSADQVLADSLHTFRGSMSAFCQCLDRCRESPSDKASAACNILVKMFQSSAEREVAEKVEPFAFDEVSVLVREVESLVKSVSRTCENAMQSIHVCGQRCGIPAASSAAPKGAETSNRASLTESVHDAKNLLAALEKDLSLFLADATRQHNVRVVAPVELEKRLAMCVTNWSTLGSTQRQDVSQCVSDEVQCRLEWRWFTSFLDQLRLTRFFESPDSPAGALNQFLLQFEQRWLRDWNKRREMQQDHFLLLADGVLASAREAVSKFSVEPPVSTAFLVLPESSHVRREQLAAAQHAGSIARGLKTHAAVGDATCSRVSSASSHRMALQRPRQALRRLLSSPPPLLNVVDVDPDCAPPPSHFRPPSSHMRSTRAPSPHRPHEKAIVVRKLQV